MADRIRALFADPPEWVRVLRGFPAYYLHGVAHAVSLWLLPYAGDWAYRRDRLEAKASEARHVG